MCGEKGKGKFSRKLCYNVFPRPELKTMTPAYKSKLKSQRTSPIIAEALYKFLNLKKRGSRRLWEIGSFKAGVTEGAVNLPFLKYTRPKGHKQKFGFKISFLHSH